MPDIADSPARGRRQVTGFHGAMLVLVIAVAGCGTTPASNVPPSARHASSLPPAPSAPAASADAAPTALRSPRPGAGSPAARGDFASAWTILVDAHDEAAVELLIANPLSEYDLVGNRLIDLVHGTRDRVSALDPPADLATELGALEAAMTSILGQLERIDPHGPRADQSAAFQRALDDWIVGLTPHAQAIRDALGLPPVPQGDLQL